MRFIPRGMIGPSPGTYKVTFTRESYSQVEKQATVRVDGTVTVNAKLFKLSG